MDSLPTEIVAHILSFLEGKDLLFSKLLSPKIQQIITRNRDVFQYPRFDLILFNFLGLRRASQKVLCMHLFKKWSCVIDCSNMDDLTITPMSDEYYSYFGGHHCTRDSSRKLSEFFRDLFERNNQKPNLREIFQYIFEKVNVDELNVFHLRNPDIFSILAGLIQTISSPIKDVYFAPYTRGRLPRDPFPELCDLLVAVANQKRKSNVYPRMKVSACNPGAFKWYWDRFVRLNEIAAFYKSFVFHTDNSLASKAILNLAQEFVNNPFPKFNFCFCISHRNDFPVEQVKIEEEFEVEPSKEDFFFRSVEHETIFLQLTHRTTKMVLTLQRKKGDKAVDRVFPSNEYSHVTFDV